MHPEDIKAAIRKQGITMAALAERLGITRVYLTQIVAGDRKPLAYQEKIALFIDKPVDEVFPSNQQAA